MLQVSQHDLSNTDPSALESNWALLVSSRPVGSTGWVDDEGRSSSLSLAAEDPRICSEAVCTVCTVESSESSRLTLWGGMALGHSEEQEEPTTDFHSPC